MKPEGTATDEASQDGRELTSSEDSSRKMNQSKAELHGDPSAENTSTGKASQNGCKSAEVANEEGSLEGTTADEASQDCHRPTIYEHYLRPTTQSEIVPTVVVYEGYRKLFKAALNGCWKDVEKILDKQPEAMTAPVVRVGDEPITVLEVAVIAAHDQLVENLAMRLDQKDDILRRALRNAARGGRIRMVKALANKINKEPKSIDLALSTAISWAPMQKDVILYLANHAPPPNDDIMRNLIMAGHLDIAYHLAMKQPKSTAIDDTELEGSLKNLVSMMSYFRGRARLGFWEKSINRCIPQCLVNSKAMKMAQAPFIKKIAELKSRNYWMVKYGKITFERIPKSEDVLKLLLTSGVVLDAASHGITEFVKLCLEYFPELMWEKSFREELIKEVVRGRHVDLFRLVNAHNMIPYLTDDNGMRCDLMEAVVEWSPSSISTDAPGSAFQIQRELQWFKVVEDMSNPSLKSQKFKVLKVEDKSDPSFKRLKLEVTNGRTGKTLWELFVDQRQDMVKEAAQFMKDTSSSCCLASTLVITVVFAAAFTVPGGNHEESGIPIFLDRDSFIVFVIADALALFSSVTATLMFLAILTARYAIEDFLHSLPRKMILGCTFLFLSLLFMMMAFGSALTIVLNKRWNWIYMPITLLATIPIILAPILSLSLYAEMVESTYWPRLYRPKKIWK